MDRLKLNNGKELVIFTREDLKTDIDKRYDIRYNLKAPKGEWIVDIFNRAFMILFVDGDKTRVLKDKTKTFNYERI